MKLHDWPRRIWLFVRDYFDEFGIAWSLARSNDCERWGGHHWGGWRRDEVMGTGRECSGCGMFEVAPSSVPTVTTTATGTTYAITWNAGSGC